MYTGMFKAIESGEDVLGFPAVIDYGARIEDLLNVRPCTYVPAEINSENFPADAKRGTQSIIVKLISFTCRPVFGEDRTDELLNAIAIDGFEPVDFRELVAVFNQYKAIQPLPRIFTLASAIDIDDDLMSPWVRESVKSRRIGFIKV